MPLSGEAIRLMNYIDDVAVTLRRVLATIPTLTAEERARVAEHLLNAKPSADDVAKPSPPSKPGLPTVAIIGAGPLGRWLALSAARAGFRVLLEDVMPANLHHAQEALRRQLGPEALGPVAGASPSVAFVSTIEDAVRSADLAIDCVPDELESKLEILWLLDRMAPPRTVLATPTTRLSIADLASCTCRPDKCIAIAAEASSLAAGAGTR
jgi:3-hydroxybutyryl-CoA dehydrogenase